jgi:hypothetical protein
MSTESIDMLEGTIVKNVGMPERWLSGVIGGLLALTGLARKSLGGILSAAVGAYLLYRGLKGHCFLYDLLGVNTRPAATLRSAKQPPPPSVTHGDEVTESSWESFPTSDPPSWTLGKREEDEPV